MHLSGFSPVWVLSCFFKMLDVEKHLSHFVHVNGFSDGEVIICAFATKVALLMGTWVFVLARLYTERISEQY